MTDDERLEQILADALAPEAAPVPSPDRIAALRRHAQAQAGQVTSPAAQTEFGRDQPTGRRAMLIGGVAATIGAAIGIGGALLASQDDGSTGPPTERVEFASTRPGVRTDAALINHTWGTELLLDVEGLPAGQLYRVDYLGGGPGSGSAGSFRSVPDTLMRCRFNAAALRNDITSVVVTDSVGAEVLRADLS